MSKAAAIAGEHFEFANLFVTLHTMSPLQILPVIGLYAALLYGVAWWGSRHADQRTFFTGGRRMAWWLVALGMIGAPMSGVSFVSVPGSVASDAFSYLQMVAGFTLGQLLIAFVLVPLFYRLQVTSLYEYLEVRFGATTHRTGATLFLVAKLLLTTLKLLVVCTVLQQVVCSPLGIPFAVNAGVSTLVVWGYTLRGGVKSVVWIDVLQTCCLIGSVAVTIWAIMHHFGWSASTLFEEVVADSRSRIFFSSAPLFTRSFGRMFVAGFFMLIAMTGLDQDLMQRNLACRSAAASQRNIIATALAQAGVITLLLVLGLLLYRYAEAVGIEASGDGLFAAVALGGSLPIGVGILFLLGLVSSTWATAGSALTALTTATIFDLLPHRFRSEAKRLNLLRITLHTLLALGIWLLMLLFTYASDLALIDLLYRVVSYAYGPILALFSFGLLCKRRLREKWVAWVCIAAPIVVYWLQQILANHAGYLIGYELILYNAILCFGGLFLISQRP